jgi:hypothetical protein
MLELKIETHLTLLEKYFKRDQRISEEKRLC